MADLTTLAKVKRYLKLDEAETRDDSLLQALVTSMSDWFKSATRRDIESKTYENQPFNGDGTPSLALPNVPVTSVTAVVIDGVSIDPRSASTAGWILDGDILRLVSADLRKTWELVFTRGYGNVVVTYVAGFSPIPQDIDQAVVELVAWRYKERDRVGIASRNVGGEVLSFSPYAAPQSVQQVVESYRAVRFS